METKVSKKSKILFILNSILFWISNIGILLMAFNLAWMFTMGGILGPVNPDAQAGINLSIYMPSFVTILILISGGYLTKLKRTKDFLPLFFSVELPILLVCFGKLALSTYPVTLIYLSFIILLSSLWIWIELLFPEKISFLSKYKYFPLATGTILSGWLFLMWVFWTPLVAWNFILALPSIIGMFFRAIFVFWFTIPAAITLAYFLLSPLLSFGMFVFQIRNNPFPKKSALLISTFVVLVGGTFLFDVVEKYGSYAEFKHTTATLNITHETEDISFDLEDIQNVSNLNRFEESLKKVYLAELKYPLSDKSGENFIHGAVYSTYCGPSYRNGISFVSEPGIICKFSAEVYEQLFFPFFYNGDFEKDRTLAQKAYAYTFDESIQKALAEEINTIKKRSFFGAQVWTNSWLNAEAGLTHEFQKAVHLEAVEYEVDYNEEIGVYTNLATFTFQNLEPGQQEVFIQFTLPDTESVVTDLKLGLNLELASQVAPRGAAKRVYEESLRRSIDPALLEQVGPRQYQLRVFPIMPNWHEETAGKQKVQFEYTAFTQDGTLDIAPQIYTRNLKIDSKTKATYSVKRSNTSDKADLSTNEITTGKSMTYEENATNSSIAGPNGSVIGVEKSVVKNTKEPVFFFDISASADQAKTKELFTQLKEKYPNNAFHTFNFKVSPAPEKAKDLVFWGPTNTQKLVTYLTSQEAQDFAEKEIVIITDESDFEIEPEESYEIQYPNMPKGSEFTVINIGERLPIFKHEFTKLLSAANQSNVLLLNEKKEILDLLESNQIVTWNANLEANQGQYTQITDPKWREALEDLLAYKRSREVLSTISDEASWTTAAKQQTEIAARAHIVNQMNSLLALENEWQKKRLEEEKEKDDKYKSDHDIGELPEGVIFNQSAPEPHLYLLLIFFLTGLWTIQRKEQE